MSERSSMVSDLSCLAVSAVMLLGLLILVAKLYGIQIEDSAQMRLAAQEQSVRRVRVAAPRGRILDRNGIILADNRHCLSIVCQCEYFQRRGWEASAQAIVTAIRSLATVTGLEPAVTEQDVLYHLKHELSVPMTVWDDIDRVTFERFCEHSRQFPGFTVVEREERDYPNGTVAAHLLGYTGSAEAGPAENEGAFYFRQREMSGRSGLEYYYDSYLKGVPGVEFRTVDSRCFSVTGETVVAATRGLDLELALNARIQFAVEESLRGVRGACVVIDPRDGGILAAASAPAYDLRLMVPHLSAEMHSRFVGNRDFRNRFCGETYAPGSTFKPITALAALSAGVSPERRICCDGVFTIGPWHMRCARRWGHGDETMRTALRDSCNPYFCTVGNEIGTNVLCRAARAFGLGLPTGVDFPAEAPGIVPDAGWKMRKYGDPWYPGDLPQMSIGQGMLTVTPLQMACVAGAIATGRLVKPHFKKFVSESVDRGPLPFSEAQLKVVREGMFAVVNDPQGGGRLGGEGVVDAAGNPVLVAGKTGTAEVGRGEQRRKNTWFIAYAPATNATVAVALVVENGMSGGRTAAPKVGEILKEVFRK